MSIIARCPACAGRPTTRLFQPMWTPRTKGFQGHARNFGQSLDLEAFWLCSDCGVVFRPSISDGFNGGVEPERAVGESFDRSFLAEQEARMARDKGLYDWLAGLGCFRSVLDVGCGVAPLARAFAERGLKATGIEPCGEEAECARRLCGLDVVTGFYGPDSFPEASFDLIAAEAVAYYFRPDGIVTFLATAARHLTAGGCVYMKIAETERTAYAAMSNQVRTLVPYDNAESIFGRLGWAVVAKTRRSSGYGFFNVVLRQVDPGSAVPLPLAKVEDIRRSLMVADYDLMRMSPRQVPAMLVSMLSALHAVQPGGMIPGLFCRLVNRVARIMGVFPQNPGRHPELP